MTLADRFPEGYNPDVSEWDGDDMPAVAPVSRNRSIAGRSLPVNMDITDDPDREFDIGEQTIFFEKYADGYDVFEIGISMGWSPAQIKRFTSHPERASILEALSERKHEGMERAVYRTGQAGNVSAQKLWLFNKASHRGWSDTRTLKVDARSQTEVVLSVKDGVMMAMREAVAAGGQGAIAAIQAAYAHDADDIIDADVIDDDAQ